MRRIFPLSFSTNDTECSTVKIQILYENTQEPIVCQHDIIFNIFLFSNRIGIVSMIRLTVRPVDNRPKRTNTSFRLVHVARTCCLQNGPYAGKCDASTPSTDLEASFPDQFYMTVHPGIKRRRNQ